MHKMHGTYTGIMWNIEAPHRDDVRLADIAHALSFLCRYGGHCQKFYSVAEHSVRVSWAVEKAVAAMDLPEMTPDRVRQVSFLALMHDAEEAYPPGDMSRPLKETLGDLNAKRTHDGGRVELSDVQLLAKRARVAICHHFSIGPDLPVVVHEADNMLLATEWRDFMKAHSPIEGLPEPQRSVITPWNPGRAELRFLLRFAELRPKYSMTDAIGRLVPKLPESSSDLRIKIPTHERDSDLLLRLVLNCKQQG